MTYRSAACGALAIGTTAMLLPAAATAQPDPYVDYRSRQEIDIRGTFRDFLPFTDPDGHPDFGAIALDGYGRFARVPDNFLDAAGKPAYSTTGFRVLQPWSDAEGRFRTPFPSAYIEAWPGDVEGVLESAEGGAVSGNSPYSEWFRDDRAAMVEPGMFRLVRVAGTDNYLFEGFIDAPGLRTGPAEADTNATYTYEFETTFVYEDDRDYFIEAASAGDYWIFIDNRMVIDGGAGSSTPVNYAGIVVDGTVSMVNSARVQVAPNTEGQVNTNASGSDTITMANSTVIGTDVNVGPGGSVSDVSTKGGATIAGDVGVLSEPIPMPPMPAVPDLGPSTGPWVRTGGTPSLAGDVHCDSFLLKTNATLNVNAPTRIVVEGQFEIENDCHVRIHSGASLEIHLLGGPIFMGNNSRLNINTQDPTLVTFFNHGSSEIYMDNGFVAYANFYSPNAQMRIANGINLYGSFYGRNLDMSNSASFTLMADPTPVNIWGESLHLEENAQRIDLDRLGWLQNDRTYSLKVFFADRVVPKSPFRMQSNIVTLNLASATKDLAKVD